MDGISCFAWMAAAVLGGANLPGSLDLHLRPATAIAGLSSAETVRANAAVNRVVEVLRATEGVGKPAPGQCALLYSYVVPAAAPVLVANATVAFPVAQQGTCAHGTEGGLTVRLNDLSAWRQTPVNGPGGLPLADARGAFYLNPRCERPLCLAVTRPGVPVMIPVTKEEHLAALERAWLAVLEMAECFDDGEGASSASQESARRAVAEARARFEAVQREMRSLTPGERRAPACQLEGRLRQVSSGVGPCPPERRLMRANPRYFDPTRRAGIQLLTIERPAEADTTLTRVFEAVAKGPLRTLVH